MITWLHILVHHFNSTPSESSKVILCICCTGSTGPTKLIFAESASHVIASLVFLDSSTTHGTERDIAFIFFSPSSQLFIQIFFARDVITVPLLPAIEADPGFTFWTLKFFNFLTRRSTHMLITASLWAVSNKRIRIELLGLFESFIFFVDFILVSLRCDFYQLFI